MTETNTSRNGRTLIAPAAVFSRWNDLAYGVWKTSDGRQVVFNRFYEPVWQRVGGVISDADASEWVKNIVSENFFYDDGHTEAQRRARARRRLIEWSKETF
jgi:hypothetical protein